MRTSCAGSKRCGKRVKKAAPARLRKKRPLSPQERAILVRRLKSLGYM